MKSSVLGNISIFGAGEKSTSQLKKFIKSSIAIVLLFASFQVFAAQLPAGFGPCEGAGCPSAYGNTNFNCGPTQNGIIGSDAAFSVFVGGNFEVTANGPAEAEGVIVIGGSYTMNRPDINGDYNIGVAGLGSCVTAPNDQTHLFVGGDVLPSANAITGETIIGALGVVGDTELSTVPSDHNFRYCAGCDELAIDTTIPDFDNFVTSKLSELNAISQCANDFDISSDSEVLAGFVRSQFDGLKFDCNSSFSTTDGSCPAGIYIVEIEDPASSATDLDRGFVIPADTSAFTDDGNTTIIVNVNDSSGGTDPVSVRVDQPALGSARFSRNLLWNFHNAAQVNVEGGVQFNGMMIIPAGDLEFRGSGFNGRLVASGNVIHDRPGSEMHNFDFVGEVPDACVTEPPATGSITIRKDAQPDDEQTFSFQVAGTLPDIFVLQDDGTPATGTSNERIFSDLAAGTYTFSEIDIPTGWSLDNISCIGATSSTIQIGSDADFDAGDVQVEVGLAAGENIICTFTNEVVPVALESCPADTNRILKNGFALVACKPGVSGSNLTSTLAVKDFTGLGALHDIPANQGPAGVQTVPTIREWTPNDFDIGGVGPQDVFSVAFDPDNGTIYTGSSRLYGDLTSAGGGVGDMTPGPAIVYRVDPQSGAVTSLVNLSIEHNTNNPGSQGGENFGIGYIDFDRVNTQLFVSGLGTGSIYRIDPTSGAVLQVFNPDIDGVAPETPTINGLAPLSERILSVAYNPVENRVYYSTWNSDKGNFFSNPPILNSIRSVQLDAGGAILPATDGLEFNTPEYLDPEVASSGGYNHPVGDIEFNFQGNTMLLSEVGFNTASPFSPIPRSIPHEARLLKFEGSAGTWMPNTSAFELGDNTNGAVNFQQGSNGRGGVDFAFHSIGSNVVNGIQDFVVATSDTLVFDTSVNPFEGVYGVQYTPIGGGTRDNSILVDFTGAPDELGKGLFGDIDVLSCASDYGDAPDTAAGTSPGNYNTQNNTQNSPGSRDNGPSHLLGVMDAPFLGDCVDADDGTQQNAAADDDDSRDSGLDTGTCASQDDEDGANIPATLSAGTNEIIPITVGSTNACTLNAWIDYNADGDFNGAGEQIATNQSFAGGATTNLTVAIPSTAAVGNTYARFRCTSASFAGGPVGPAPDGEVEDYLVTIAVEARDYGDAPDTDTGTGTGNYNTTEADGGASHIVSPLDQSRLGNCVDVDNGTLQNAAALADDADDGAIENGTCTANDDEDGVTLPASLTAGSDETITILKPVGSECVIDGWIDFNQNGSFADTGEQVIIGTGVESAGSTDYTAAIPSTATVGTTYARFRCTSNLTGTGPTGPAFNGEVEDYQVEIVAGTQTLRVEKVVEPDGDPGQFIMNANGTAGTAGGDGAFAEAQVLPGATEVEIGETANAGTDLANYTSETVCLAAGGGTVAISDGTITMPEDDVTCTITNTRRTVVLTVFKTVIPANDPGIFTLSGGGVTSLPDVAANIAIEGDPPVGATATFTESGASGTSLDDYTSTFECTGDTSGDTLSSGTGTEGTVDVVGDENISCTFTNTRILVSLGNLVWMDNGADTDSTDDGDANGVGVAGNGIQDGDEPGVGGVAVELFNIDDNPNNDNAVATTTTNATDGTYVFNDLQPGTYFVHLPLENFTTGPLAGKITTIGADATDEEDDQNGVNNSDNGVDGGDLITEGLSSNDIILSGDNEPTNDLGDADDDSDEDASNSRSSQDDDNTNFSVDFAVYEPVSIGNLVWMDNGADTDSTDDGDTNGLGIANNGIQDGNEAGVAGVTVELYSSTQTVGGTNSGTTQTLGDGSYVFDSVPPGDYLVHIPGSQFAASGALANKISTTGQDLANADEDQNGSANSDDGNDEDDLETNGVSSLLYSFTANGEPTGAADLGDADDDSDVASSTAQSTLPDNDTNFTIDFGFYEPVAIGNLVWMDNGVDDTPADDANTNGLGISNNGILDGDETGVGEVLVQLFVQGADVLNDDPVATTETASDGSYVLTAPPGSYFVHIPASEFADGEPLDEKISSDGQDAVDRDDNLAGSDDGAAEDGGVSSPVYELVANEEPTNEVTNGGFEGSTVSPVDDDSTNNTADFGFYQRVSIGNLVWMDNGVDDGIPNDGIKQDDEPGIGGVVVELYREGQNPLNVIAPFSTATNGDGVYTFDDLEPGAYFVHIPASEFAEGEPLEGKVSSFGQGDADNAVDDNAGEDGDDIETDGVSTGIYDLLGGDEPELEAGFGDDASVNQDDDNTNATADFGFLVPVSVGSLVWDDLNADGLQGANEPPISAVTVNLMVNTDAGFAQAEDLQGEPVANQTTAADGLYFFDDLPPGEYKVTVTPPPGYAPSTQSTNVDDIENDSNIVDEPNVGDFESVTFILASGEEAAESDVQRGDNQDGNANSPADLSGNMTIDFGFVRLSSIGDYVWLDLDQDGVQDANENGIPNVRVKLIPPTGVDVGNGPNGEIDTVTDSNGGYIFRDLPPFVNADASEGYITMVDTSTLPEGVIQTFDEGPNGEVGVLDHMSDPIQLDPEEAHRTADFGYVPELGAIGDRVWVDADGDGQQDPGEPGIEGVTVKLTPPADVDAGEGDGEEITDITDANGNYYFPDLPLNENYIVMVVDRETIAPEYSKLANGDPDVRDGNATEHDDQSTVVITDDDPINLDADFGYLPDPEVNNKIGDTVWKDINKDGVIDADEPLLANVTLLLQNEAGDVVGDALTNDVGMYMFSGLPDGDYTVIVNDVNNVTDGLIQTYDDDDGNNLAPLTPKSSFVDDLGVGDDQPVFDEDQDFGFAQPSNAGNIGELGDQVFFDENNSGAPDEGEGIEGVTLNLMDGGPDGDITTVDDNRLIGTTTTDRNGFYGFPDLSVDDTGPDAGTVYKVTVDITTLPNGSTEWVNSVDRDSGNPGDSMSTADLVDADGQRIDLGLDFGYVSQSNNSLEGSVWPDTDGDGMQDEVGVFADVTMEMKDERNNVFKSTSTDSTGRFRFGNLPDGKFKVEVTDENNVLNGFQHTDAPDGPTDTSDETSKDDTGYEVDLDSAVLIDEPVNDVTSDFGYKPVITNPISLGSFIASESDDGVTFVWQTQTEVANLGFYLYDEWQRLSDDLIPSQGDSVSVQSYELVLVTNAQVFALADIDLTGKETLHGPFMLPFMLGESHGFVGDRKSIDWSAEKAERDTMRAARKAKRLEKQKQRQQQRKQRRSKAAEAQKLEETSMIQFPSRPSPPSQPASSLRGAAEAISMPNRPTPAWYIKPIAAVLSALVPVAHAAQSDGSAGEDIVNLATQVAGLHQVTHAELLAVEVDLDGVPVADIALMNAGSPVPIAVHGSSADAAVFGPGGHLRFAAAAVDTLYTDTNIYTLRLDQDDAARLPVINPAMPSGAAASAYLAQAKYAPQAKYSFVSPNKGDPWYAKRVVAVGEAESDTVNVVLDNVAVGGNTGSTTAKLSVDLWGSTDLPGPEADHHVKVSVNGTPVVDGRFDGLIAKRFDSPLENLKNGNNSVTLELPMDTGQAFDAVNVNEIVIRYPRQFVAQDNRLSFESSFAKFSLQGFDPLAGDDELIIVQQNAAGTALIGNAQVGCRGVCEVEFASGGGAAQYYVSSSAALHSATLQALPLEQDINSGQAAYLIISHPDFLDNANLQALAADLADEFGSADVVDVEAIYAQVGHHVFDPSAIQTYIQQAATTRGTQMVLLVGGDVYDYRQFETQDAESFIPSLYAATGNNITFAPVDAKYVDLDNDNVPDLPIGRLPVRTNSQLNALLGKRQAYLDRDYPGTALLVADEYDQAQQYDFSDDAEEISADYLQGWATNKVYVDEVKANGGSVGQARAELTSQINQGQTLTAFFGHSSTSQWAFNGLFTGPDAANLQNQGKPTVVTQWGCWNAYYVSPSEDSMGHRFMMEGDQGAVAVMGASTLTSADAERQLARKVFERLANGERLGDAITNAKQEYAQDNPNDLDVLLGWTLLGLPELVVN